MPQGPALNVAIVYSVIVPLVVILPIMPAMARFSANHRLPSGPAAIPYGCELAVGVEYSTIGAPLVLIFPILLLPNSVNQRLPSGPVVMS